MFANSDYANVTTAAPSSGGSDPMGNMFVFTNVAPGIAGIAFPLCVVVCCLCWCRRRCANNKPAPPPPPPQRQTAAVVVYRQPPSPPPQRQLYAMRTVTVTTLQTAEEPGMARVAASTLRQVEIVG
ncbi:uncharacterized protein LOC125941579 [Dermacentor silvarum]|uniref:uncharacterized protein LOC125941579 n=1 Tax=Dermacentor silvarum TaxID=543639 RepID=UPI00210107D2|nr:uncharacterized protein LOC125941579 [Dermacentor silvarum]